MFLSKNLKKTTVLSFFDRSILTIVKCRISRKNTIFPESRRMCTSTKSTMRISLFRLTLNCISYHGSISRIYAKSNFKRIKLNFSVYISE